MKCDLLDGRWERRVASALPSSLHDIIGLGWEGGNRRGLTSFNPTLGFGLEQVTLLVHTSTDQSRDLELSPGSSI